MKSQFRAPWFGSVLSAALILVLSLGTIIGLDAGIAALRVKGDPLPEYGTWTGITTLERKLVLLREFASHGPVDAVIIGASVSDHGLSAEILSRNLSASYGRNFRVFNLSTGGAETTTLLILYRLAQVIVAPKQIWIAFPAEPAIGDTIDNKAPDYALLRSPVGSALRHPWLLPVSFRFFQLPLVHYARALRDLAIYGNFVTRPVTQLDFYDINAFGDSNGFFYYSRVEPFREYVTARRELILALGRRYKAGVDERAKAATYFGRSAVEALAKLRASATHDRCTISILALDTSAGFAAQDEPYLRASELFYEVMSERLNAPVIDVRSSFRPAGYKFTDSAHLNSIGADEFSELIAANIAQRPPPKFPQYAISEEASQNVPNPKLTNTAVIIHQASDPRTQLELRFLQGPGVPPLRPHSRIQLLALLPDNHTIAVPANVVSRGRVLANTSQLPVSDAGQVLLLQLTPVGARWGNGLGFSLSSYHWSDSAPSEQDISGAATKVFTAKASYTPLQPIQGSWTGIDDPMAKDWVGVFPVEGDNGTRLSMRWTGGRAAGEFELPSNPSAKPGQYEVRLYANDGWDLLAFSKPFSISPLTATVESTSASVNRGASIHAVWRNLDPPTKDDWVGLFPRGGPNQSRLDFRFTGGTAQGATDLTVPASAPPGDYELRLYAAGSWTMVATSAAFKVVAASSHSREPKGE
jgi:hypothetical protein